MTRPALTWLALWLGIATAVAAGIIAGFVLLSLLVPDVRAASRPVAQPTAPVDVSRSASAVRLPGAPRSTVEAPHGQASPSPSPVATATPGRGQTPGRTPIPSARDTVAIVLAARSGTRVAGTASTYGPAFGPGWLALPEGPGARVRVCGPAACIVRTSNDAGPDLAMQRAGRIVDLSLRDFEVVCGCSWRRGLVDVTVEYLP